MEEFKITVDRISVRAHTFVVEALDEDEAVEKAYNLAENFDYSNVTEGGVEYEVSEVHDSEGEITMSTPVRNGLMGTPRSMESQLDYWKRDFKPILTEDGELRNMDPDRDDNDLTWDTILERDAEKKVWTKKEYQGEIFIFPQFDMVNKIEVYITERAHGGFARAIRVS